MPSIRFLLACTICHAALFGPLAMTVQADSVCKEPEAGSKHAPMLSPPTSNVVTGTGRLRFYSAPNPGCAMKGVFVIPKDELTAYVLTDDGWASVMYINPRTGDDVSGWVRSDRLKRTGTVGPKQ